MASRQIVLLTAFLVAVPGFRTASTPTEAGRVDYTGHRLVSVTPTTAAQVDALAELTLRLRIDVWSHAGNVGSSALLRLDPQAASEFMATATQAGLNVTTVCSNLQKAIDDERGQMRSATHSTEETPRFESFLTYTELKDALKGYAKDYDHVTYTTIGKSYEGRDLIAAHIKTKPNLPVVWLQCGIHPREWISHAVCLYIIDQLATRYKDDEEIRHLVSTYEWRIHPVVNPDGYHYTHTVDRFWRKTLSKNNASSALCRGADANRNFDTREFCRTFHGQPSSSDPCSITYCGSGPFSEPETRAIRDAVMAIKDRTKFFFDMHSYGTMWMFPHGYTGTRVPEYDELLKISRKASAAIERVQGSVYRVGSMYETAYPISGGSADWAYDTAGVKKSFSIELQPKSSIFGVDFGFLFPSKRILPTAKEAWEGIKAAVLF